MSTDSRPLYHQIKKPNWAFWLALFLLIASMPMSWYTASTSLIQVKADDCSQRQQWGRNPNSGFPEFTLEQINECNAMRSKASTYFFLAALAIAFDMIALEGLIMRRVSAYIAYGLGMAFVLLISLIMLAGVPWPIFYFNLPVLLFLFYLKRIGQIGIAGQ